MQHQSSASRAPFTLVRVHPDGTEEQVSGHQSFEEGWQAGTRAVTVEDKQGAYSLYERGRRVAKFGHARLIPRASTMAWELLS